MIKIYSILALITIHFFMMAQEVDKNFVVAEFGTGTWCVYCPGAAMGAEDLIANGHDVAVIKYHNGDDFANATSTRLTYYGVSGFPTAIFDGQFTEAGGNPNNSLYDSYIDHYNSAMAIKSPYEISIEHSVNGSFCDANIIVKEVADYPYPVQVHLVVTESNIEYEWQNQDMLHFVARKMVPNTSGTSLDLELNETDTLELNFEIDDAWAFENCEIIAFIQNNSTKAILNADKKYLEIFEHDYNAEVNSITLPINNGLCGSTISPEVEIINKGNETITSLEFTCNVNDGADFVYTWEGEIKTRLSKTITIPDVELEVLQDNSIQIEITKVNDQADGFTDNNTIHDSFGAAPETADPYLNLEILTDSYGSETTWVLYDENNDTVYSGGPYTNEVVTYNLDLTLEANGCYELYFYDKAGDGMEIPGFETGYYILSDQEGKEIISGGSFDFVEFNSFGLNANFNGTEILSFAIDTANAVIDAGNKSIEIDLVEPLEVIIPSFELSPGAKLYYNDSEVISGETIISPDYDQAMTFTVKAGNGIDEEDWTLSIHTATGIHGDYSKRNKFTIMSSRVILLCKSKEREIFSQMSGTLRYEYYTIL